MVVMSKAATTKDGQLQEDTAPAVLLHNLGRLEIGKFYEGEAILSGTSSSQEIKSFPEAPFNISVLVSESEDASIALQALTEAFNANKGDVETALKDLIKDAIGLSMR